MGRLGSLVATCGLFTVLVTGCGAEESVSDDEIVEAVNLERDAGAYTIGGDPFCEVNDELLNDSEEVDAATEGDELGLVITNRSRDVGIEGVPPFDPKCARKAKRALNALE